MKQKETENRNREDLTYRMEKKTSMGLIESGSETDRETSSEFQKQHMFASPSSSQSTTPLFPTAFSRETLRTGFLLRRMRYERLPVRLGRFHWISTAATFPSPPPSLDDGNPASLVTASRTLCLFFVVVVGAGGAHGEYLITFFTTISLRRAGIFPW